MYTESKVPTLVGGLLRAFAVVVLLASPSLASGASEQVNPAVNGADEVLTVDHAMPEPGSGMLLLAGVVLLGSAAIGRKIRGNSEPTRQIEER